MTLKDKIALIREGDVILVSEKPTWKYTTWLIPFIRFFQNMWAWVRSEPYIKFHHTANAVIHNGELVLTEA